jgi:hypothetical protein
MKNGLSTLWVWIKVKKQYVKKTYSFPKEISKTTSMVATL